MSKVGGSRLKLAGYAAWAAANLFLLVVQFMRDDTQWWKVALFGFFLVISIGGALEQGRALKAKPVAESEG